MIEGTILSGLRNRDELHAELFGALGQVMHDALAIAFLVIVLPFVGIFLALGEHRVDQPRKLVRRSGDGLGLIHA